MTEGQKMTTLVIHAPRNRKTPFATILATGIGPGYAIYDNLKSKLSPNPTVVLLANNLKLRAEGQLGKLVPTGIFTKNGIQRYDVHIKGLMVVSYKPEKLNRCGVAVIDC